MPQTPPTEAETRALFNTGDELNEAAFTEMIDYAGRQSIVDASDFFTTAELAAALTTDGTPGDTVFANILTSLGQGGGAINWPVGIYTFTAPIHLHKRIRLNGQAYIRGGGNFPAGDGRVTIFKFAAGINGIVVHAYNTDEDVSGPVPGANVTTTPRGDGTLINNIVLQGGGTASGTGHGIWMRGAASCSNVTVTAFGGNGFNIVADVTTGGDAYGNANLFQLWGCTASNNGGHGFFADGGDANAGITVMFNAAANGGHGMFDSSFLGNTHIAAHTNSNGLAVVHPTGSSSRVHRAGRRYHCTGLGNASTTAPTVGMNYEAGDPWDDVAPGVMHATLYPEWVDGNDYHYAAGYYADSSTARNMWLSCYAESDQSSARVQASNMFIGGLQAGEAFKGVGVKGGIYQDGANVYGQLTYMPRVDDTAENLQLVIRRAPDRMLNMLVSGDHVLGIGLGYFSNWGVHGFIHGNLQTRMGLGFLTDNKVLSYGRSAASDHTSGTPLLPLGVILGEASVARHITYGSAAPTTGYRARGEIVFNNSPTAGGTVGWVCTTAGTPGTWKTFGTIEA